MRAFYEAAGVALKRDMTIDEMLNLPQNEQIARFKEVPNDKFKTFIDEFLRELPEAFKGHAGAAAGGDGQRGPAAKEGAR